MLDLPLNDRGVDAIKWKQGQDISVRSLGVDFVSFNESIDTTSPTGKLLFQIIAALGAFERSVLIERVHAGLRRARLQGRTLGRPTVEFDIEKAKTLRAQGLN